MFFCQQAEKYESMRKGRDKSPRLTVAVVQHILCNGCIFAIAKNVKKFFLLARCAARFLSVAVHFCNIRPFPGRVVAARGEMRGEAGTARSVCGHAPGPHTGYAWYYFCFAAVLCVRAEQAWQIAGHGIYEER
jgi:hypothetical protein